MLDRITDDHTSSEPESSVSNTPPPDRNLSPCQGPCNVSNVTTHNSSVNSIRNQPNNISINPTQCAMVKNVVEVVISGIAGRFPSSDSVDEFKQNLYNGVDMVTSDSSRWPVGTFCVLSHMHTTCIACSKIQKTNTCCTCCEFAATSLFYTHIHVSLCVSLIFQTQFAT